MYLYVPNTYCFDYSCTAFLLFLKGTYLVHTDSRWVCTLSSWFYCAPAWLLSRFACQQFRHRPTHWTKPHSAKHLQFYSLLLGSTLVSAWAPSLGAGAGGLLGDSAAAGQLHQTHHSYDQLSAHQQHQPQPAMQCWLGPALLDLGFKLGSQWWAAKYSSNPAKFMFKLRDFIRDIKQRADLAWSWAVQMMTGTSTFSSY